jgi:hypothetical protein
MWLLAHLFGLQEVPRMLLLRYQARGEVMNALLALAPVGAWGIGEWIIAIIVIAACVGVMYVALNYFGVQIPPWAIRIFWIVVVACVAVFAVRLMLSM